ncbi:MAG: hypothetical protein IKN55_09185 [Oscillospiraceae bacterium]|nr:hypothetical protein [Oscillospiraceae bacterium]
MRKQELQRLLHHLDEQDAARLGEAHLELTEAEHERILQKISRRTGQGRMTVAEQLEKEPVIPQSARHGWIVHAVSAAACIAVCVATTASVCWLNANAPARPEDSEPLQPSDAINPVVCHTIGERYAAENLTASGTLWVTVTDKAQEDGKYRITLLLESENAVSCAEAAMGEPTFFFADNLVLLSENTDGTQHICQPCAFSAEGHHETGLPYCISLRSGQQCRLTLWYAAEPGTAWRLAAGLAPDAPYTMITED